MWALFYYEERKSGWHTTRLAAATEAFDHGAIVERLHEWTAPGMLALELAEGWTIRRDVTPQVEAVAEVTASFKKDGLEGYRRCRDNPTLDETEGYYTGGNADAEEFIARLNARGFNVVADESVKEGWIKENG